MPIRREVRHHYRGPGWELARRRILKRSGGRCEWCAKPDRTEVLAAPDGRWTLEPSPASSPVGPWRDDKGRPAEAPWGPSIPIKCVFVVLTIAHLNHEPGDDRPENLAALCQRCHLRYDAPMHRRRAALTRRAKLNNLELAL